DATVTGVQTCALPISLRQDPSEAEGVVAPDCNQVVQAQSFDVLEYDRRQVIHAITRLETGSPLGREVRRQPLGTDLPRIGARGEVGRASCRERVVRGG